MLTPPPRPACLLCPQVEAPFECASSAWIGGAIFARLDTFDQKVVTKAEYEESGPTVVHTKWP